MSQLFEFPNPVNEKAARTVAGVVLVLSIVTLALSFVNNAWLWIVAVLAYGFVARVLTGPTLSPLGTIAMKVIAPRLGEPNPVAGPPKRFAQGVGAAFTGSGVIFLAVGLPGVTQILLGFMIIAAGLESIFAYCLGCKVFAVLMRIGWIPESTCEACNNVTARLDQALSVTSAA